MSKSFDVYVLDSNGDAVAGKRVVADFGLLTGQAEEFTDDDGHASFETFGNPTKMRIIVDGDVQGEYELDDGAGYTVNI